MPIGRKGREEEEKFLTRSLVTCEQRGDERADIFFDGTNYGERGR